MKRLSEIIMIFLFSAVIFTVPVVMLCEEKAEKLLYENRNVAEVLPFNNETFGDGTFFESAESYLSDIFPLRNNILALHTYIDGTILNKPVINDVVYQGDDVPMLPVVAHKALDEEATDRKTERMAESISRLSDVCHEVGSEFYFVGIPEQYSYFRNRYPEYIYNNKENLELEERLLFDKLNKKGVRFINMNMVFTNMGRSDDLYSYTDHHFSFEGAYETYRTIVSRINADLKTDVKILDDDDFDFKEVPNPYLGSRNRKLMGVYDIPEKAVIADFADRVPFLRTDNGKVMESVVYTYPMDPAEIIDYMIYMGGDVGETIFETHRDELPDILVFGDSFTNPIETLIYTGFDETRCIDLRHYNEKTITEYVRDFSPDAVIMIRDDTRYLDFTGNGDIK